MDIIKEIENELVQGKELPTFQAGDTVVVSYKIKEGDKERIQNFQGVVLQRRGSGATETFTVRKMSVMLVLKEFSLFSPFIEDIKVTKRGRVRRARIFYLRERTGKSSYQRKKIR